MSDGRGFKLCLIGSYAQISYSGFLMNSAAVLKPSAASQDSHAQWLDALRFVSAMVVVVVAHVRGAAFLDFASLDAGSQTPATALFLQ